MAHEIVEAVARIQERRKGLEAEIERLKTAEQVLRGLAQVEESPATASVPPSQAISLSNAVRQAVADLDGAETPAIMRYIRRNLVPKANANSIRSLLSVLGRKGEFQKRGKKWFPLSQEKTELVGMKGGEA